MPTVAPVAASAAETWHEVHGSRRTFEDATVRRGKSHTRTCWWLCNEYKYVTGSKATAIYSMSTEKAGQYWPLYGTGVHHSGTYRLVFERPNGSWGFSYERYKVFTSTERRPHDWTHVATFDAPKIDTPRPVGWRHFNRSFTISGRKLVWVVVTKRYPHDGKRLGLDGMRIQVLPGDPLPWMDTFRESLSACNFNPMSTMSDAVWRSMMACS